MDGLYLWEEEKKKKRLIFEIFRECMEIVTAWKDPINPIYNGKSSNYSYFYLNNFSCLIFMLSTQEINQNQHADFARETILFIHISSHILSEYELARVNYSSPSHYHNIKNISFVIRKMPGKHLFHSTQ